MKRYGDLFEKIVDVKNIIDAHKNAQKGKRHYKEVHFFDQHLYHNARVIRKILKERSYEPSAYTKMIVCDRGKPREILKTKYYPDRIIHHALMQVIEPIFEKMYIKDTYQSIKGRGTHKAIKRVKSFMKDEVATRYCLKLDIKKFYPSVDNETMKMLFRKRIKDEDTLWLLDTIIDSTNGLPIGNYTSQAFANYYLSFFDHFIKEELCIKHYVRYADDMVIFSEDKEPLHIMFSKIKSYLNTLKLTIKKDWQIFETRLRGLDFLGYRIFGNYTLLRKKMATKIKRAFSQNISSLSGISRIMSYIGWMEKANTYNLLRTLIDKTFLAKIRFLSKYIGIKNPFKGFTIVPKKLKKTMQLTLF